MSRAAWEAVPEAAFGFQNSDNVVRSQQNPQSGSRAFVDAAVALRNFNNRGNIFLSPRVIAESYSETEHQQFENTDKFLNAGGEYAWQNLSAGFRTNYANEGAFRAEFSDAVLDDPDAEEPIIPETGIVEGFNFQRKFLTYAGNVDFRLSERNDLRLDVERVDNSYVNAPPRDFYSDFKNTSVSLALLRTLTQRSQADFGLFANQYTADRQDNTTDSIGLEGSIGRSLSQTWALTVYAGVQQYDASFLATNDQDRIEESGTDGWLAVGIRKRSQQSTWNLRLGTSYNPSSAGYIYRRTSARIYLRQQFSPRLSGRFGVIFDQAEPLGDTGPQFTRDYGRLQIDFEWAMTQTLLLTFGIDSFRQEFSDQSGDTLSVNSLSVGVRYRGLSRSAQ